MKKTNIFLLILLVVDLLFLMNFKQVQQNVSVTFSINEILFYWFYFFPAAYLIGGYLLGQVLLLKGDVFLDRKIEKGFLIFGIACLLLYLVGAVVMTVHHFTPILSGSAATGLIYSMMETYIKYVPCFAVLGLVLSVCISSYLKQR